MKGVLIDLDGVIYQANKLLPGVQESLDWLQAHDIPYLFATNTTSKPRSEIVKKLLQFGVLASDEQILTPVVAAKEWLSQSPGASLALFLPDATREEFAEFKQTEHSEEHIDAVIMGDMGQNWSFAQLNRAFNCLMNNPKCALLALGMTRYWRAAAGLQLDVGPFVQALTFASGRAPVVLGKPDPVFFAMGAKRLGVATTDLVMIGDDARSDVQAAQNSGLFGVLVKTGKFQQQDLDSVTPDALLDSFADLPAHWASWSFR